MIFFLYLCVNQEHLQLTISAKLYMVTVGSINYNTVIYLGG